MSDTNDTDKDVNKTDSESSGEQKVPEVSFESIKDNKGVSLENRWSEMSRKLNDVSEIKSKLDQVLNNLAQQQAGLQGTSEQSINTDDDEFDGMSAKQVAVVIDKKLAAREKTQLQEKHLSDFDKLKDQYPELDSTSDDYDPEFYKLANSNYLSLGLDAKPNGAEDAVKYAAYLTGRTKKELEAEVLSDEARRSRKLSEGTRGSSKAKPEVNDDEALKQASKYMKINPKYYKQAKINLGL